MPERKGKLADVLLGYDDVTGYESRKYFFGAAIGRCGNRIARGRFELNGFIYKKRGGMCIETQFAPDAVNKPSFESPILRAGDKYDETTIYRFDVK